jgi:hypothetical protein
MPPVLHDQLVVLVVYERYPASCLLPVQGHFPHALTFYALRRRPVVVSQPIETKVAAGGAVSALTGVITWVLTTYVPAFQNGLPAPLAAFLPYLVSVVAGTVAAYLAPHTNRPDEVVAEAVQQLQAAGVTLPKG